ncbi:MAG TPA: hypothetical protein VK489_00855 [Ferruginibacter sp.]|nr:hypothetical protein [Ferruginibacter sp.]
MKKQLLLAVLLLSSVSYFSACKREKNTVTPTATLNDMGDFVNKYGAPKQTFSFNTSDLPRTFTLNAGTKITLYPGSLTKNNIPVSGALTLEAYEIMKRSDAIFTGTNTNHHSGAPLISDGFFFIDVKANGISVDKMMPASYDVAMPTTREGEFTNLWVGNTDLDVAGQMGWMAPINGGADSIKGLDSLFSFSMRELGWVNCDIFYASNAPKTTVTITLVNNPGALATFMGGSGETFVLFCAQGENVVSQLYTPAGTNMVKSYDDSMPIGMTGRLVAFSIKDGKFYFAKQDVTISTNMGATLSLAEVTEAALEAEINALDSY